MPEPLTGSDRRLQIETIDPRHLRALVTMDGIGLWEWSPIDNGLRLNDALRAIVGLDGVVPGRMPDLLSLIHSDDQVAVRSVMNEVRVGAVRQVMLTLRMRQPDGHWKWICFHGCLVEADEVGRPTLLMGVGFEADDGRAGVGASTWPKDVESFLDDIDIAAWWYDARSDTSIRSRRSTMMLGYMPQEVRPNRQGWLDLVHPDDRSRVGKTLAGLNRVRQDTYQHEYRLRCRNGSYLWVLDRIRVHARDARGRVEVSSGLFVDISVQVEARQALEMLSSTDGLTGIANRRTFDDSLSSLWCASRRDGRPLSLLLIDVDHFKSFNDRHGHQAGDDCLRALAQAVSGVLDGAQCRLARYGGEEFAALLPGCGTVEALRVADRICRAVRELSLPAVPARPGQPPVSVSIGLACSDDGTLDSPEQLLGAADGALYAAKHRGRDRVVSASGRLSA